MSSSTAPAALAPMTNQLHKANSPRLSPREAEVLRQVAWGYTNKEIASDLRLSVKTIEAHKANGMRKLCLKRRADVVRYALQQHWLDLETAMPSGVHQVHEGRAMPRSMLRD